MSDFTVVIERDEEGNFIASVPALVGCHTQGRTLDEAMERIKEAILLCLEDEEEPPNTQFIGVHRVAV